MHWSTARDPEMCPLATIVTALQSSSVRLLGTSTSKMASNATRIARRRTKGPCEECNGTPARTGKRSVFRIGSFHVTLCLMGMLVGYCIIGTEVAVARKGLMCGFSLQHAV